MIRRGDEVDPVELVERLVAMGYRREYQVEGRGEVAVRGSIVDVFGATADSPARVDLWGDEVDRLTTFRGSRTSAATMISTSWCCTHVANWCRPTAIRERAASLVATEPWGREQWERLADGETFDGMESWLPWLVEGDRAEDAAYPHLLTEALPPEALILVVEPRRLRDRAGDVLAEEADLAQSLAVTWGAADRAFPALHLPFDDLLAEVDLPAWSVTVAPEGPNVATVSAAGWAPVVGDGAPLVRQLRQLLADGFRVVVGADGAGSAARLAHVFADGGVDVALDTDGTADLTAPGARITVAPLERLHPPVRQAGDPERGRRDRSSPGAPAGAAEEASGRYRCRRRPESR